MRHHNRLQAKIDHTKTVLLLWRYRRLVLAHIDNHGL